ncbi:hypothetical protein D3C75_1185200 [compost metagenome]
MHNGVHAAHQFRHRGGVGQIAGDDLFALPGGGHGGHIRDAQDVRVRFQARTQHHAQVAGGAGQ